MNFTAIGQRLILLWLVVGYGFNLGFDALPIFVLALIAFWLGRDKRGD